MALVRIDLIEGRTDEEIALLADTIQEVLIETFATPVLDRYQIIHEHRPGLIKALNTGLGYKRTDKIVVIQITSYVCKNEQGAGTYRNTLNRFNYFCYRQ